MRAKVKIIAGVPRVVDADTGRISKTENGKARDGGRARAQARGDSVAYRQVSHINTAMEGTRK